MSARLLFIALCLSSVSLFVDGRRVIRASPNAPTTGCYIVKLQDSVTHEQFESVVKLVAPLTNNTVLYERVEGEVANLFSLKMTYEQAHLVKHLPHVEYVEEETYARMNQCSMSWAVDRIDQVSSRLNCQYNPGNLGAGSDIYILDTGIRFDHEQFQGRAKYPGYDPMDNYNRRRRRPRTIRNGLDCESHGTHVASLAGGRTRGTAPKATLYSVRVLDCQGSGPWSVIIDGLNYAVQQIRSKRRPAVVSMSLGGDYIRSVQDAVRRAHSLGVTVVVAAGNERDNACLYSPASSNYVITVGGTAPGDNLYFSTNGGSCVDIYAPGDRIPGAYYTCPTCAITFSGTSMAAPFVSGVAAILLQRQPSLTPSEVKAKLISDSTKNLINFNQFSATLRQSSYNRLLYITAPPPTTAPPTTIPTTAPPTTIPTTAPPTIIPTTAPPTEPPVLDCSKVFDLSLFGANITQGMKTLVGEGMNYLHYLAKERMRNNQTKIMLPQNLLSIGAFPKSPVKSCQFLRSLKPYLQSGYYWIKHGAKSVNLFCEMDKDFLKNDSLGWTQISNFNMESEGATCPSGLKLVNLTKAGCGRAVLGAGCSSAIFPAFSISYSKVCGRVIGYQHSSPNAFYVNTYKSPVTINDYYVDGASLTYNSSKGREHIWTFAAALDEVDRIRQHGCPCTITNSTYNIDYKIPSFVGNDYFCETGSRKLFQYHRFYHEDPLWDGAGCGQTNTCCQRGSIFCKTLPQVTTSDIELRVCANEGIANEDVPISIVELYVQ